VSCVIEDSMTVTQCLCRLCADITQTSSVTDAVLMCVVIAEHISCWLHPTDGQKRVSS